MTARCATCKHWRQAHSTPRTGPDPRPGYGFCDVIYADDSFNSELKLAVIHGGECYGEQLETLPSFGCVLHSDLEPKQGPS